MIIEKPQEFPLGALSKPYKHLAFIFSLLKPFGEVRVLTLAGTQTLRSLRTAPPPTKKDCDSSGCVAQCLMAFCTDEHLNLVYIRS
jgi:hypothetical protein